MILNNRLPALVVGGGIGGLVAALALAEQHFDVDVFEQASEFSEIGAGIQLSPNCTRVLFGLGLEAALRAIAFVPQGAEMRDWQSGQVLSFSVFGDTMVRDYGFPYLHVHRADLIQVLVRQAAQQPQIQLHPGTTVSAVEQQDNQVSVTIHETGNAHSKFVSGAVLIGADGIHSVVHRALFGPQTPTFTGNVAWRALVPASRLPAALVRPMATAWWGPNKHFVHYYVRGGDLVNCVCVVEKQGWEVESWSQRGDIKELKADFAGWHPNLQTLIAAIDQDALYKWALFDRPPMAQWGRQQMTLLGDACHPTLPFMAQGAAMAIEDAAVLARCLAGSQPVAAQLRRYEDLRRDRTARVQQGSRRNARIFHLAGAPAWARNKALQLAPGKPLHWVYKHDVFNDFSKECG